MKRVGTGNRSACRKTSELQGFYSCRCSRFDVRSSLYQFKRSFFNYAGQEGLRRRWNAILDQLLPKEIASKLRTSGDTSLTLRWPLYSRSIVAFTQMTSGFFHKERSSVHCRDKWQAQESAPRLDCPSDKAQFRHAGPKFASGRSQPTCPVSS